MSGTGTPARREGAFGVERIGPGAGGKAVRLADLVRGLMAKEQTARADAVERFLLPLLKGGALPLYSLRPGGFAQPVSETEWFATDTARRDLDCLCWWDYCCGDDEPRYPSGSKLGKGVVGAAAWLEAVWADPLNADGAMDDERTPATYLAVSEADARACWGWVPAGEEAQEATPSGQAAPGTDAPEQWTGERLKKRRDELKASGVAKYMKRLSLESGLGDRKIRHLITAEEKAAKHAETASDAGPWQGLLKKDDNVTPITGSWGCAGRAADSGRNPAARRKGAAGR